MENKHDNARKPDSVPFIVHENALMRAERQIKRLWVALVIAIICCALIAGGFLLYLNQYDFSDYEYTQDGQGVNIIGDGNGVDYNGPTPANQGANQEEPQDGAGNGNPQT